MLADSEQAGLPEAPGILLRTVCIQHTEAAFILLSEDIREYQCSAKVALNVIQVPNGLPGRAPSWRRV